MDIAQGIVLPEARAHEAWLHACVRDTSTTCFEQIAAATDLGLWEVKSAPRGKGSSKVLCFGELGVGALKWE